MADDAFRIILAANPQNGSFRQWFLEYFHNRDTSACDIEEFAIFFLNFIRNQTDDFTKASSSACSTPRKVIGKRFEHGATPVRSSTEHTTLFDPNKTDHNAAENNTASCDRLSMNESSLNESTKRTKSKQSHRMLEWMQSSQPTNDNELGKSPVTSYCNFASDLKTKPTSIAVRRKSEAVSTPIKSTASFQTSTPSFNRSSYSQEGSFNRSSIASTSARSHQQQSLNSTRSNDDSHNMSDVSGKLHDRSRDKRNKSTATMCLGDFLGASKQSQKQRKSLNASDRSMASPNTPHTTSNDKDFPSFTPKGRTNRITLTSSAHKSDEKRMTMADTTPPSMNFARKAIPAADVKKRVAPTRISTTTNSFNCPAFRSENNILELPHEDTADSAHEILKAQKEIIRRAFQEEEPLESNLRAMLREGLSQEPKASPVKSAPAIDFKRITHKTMLDKFIDIYSIVLDMNLVANVLTEFAYLVNLVNVDVSDCMERAPHTVYGAVSATVPFNGIGVLGETDISSADSDRRPQDTGGSEVAGSTCAPYVIDSVRDVGSVAAALLRNVHNCVYFSIGVLQSQQNVLRLLDITTIKVLLQNERLVALNAPIKDDLMAVCSYKMQLEKTLRTHNTTNTLAPNTSMKVFYQQEHDTQSNFPTSREFAAFKKQRDMFYSILAAWESKHLSPTWDFEVELGRRVRAMLTTMDHPINMAHMAKLFTSQLILSCNFNVAIQSELQFDLPNVDLTKLNRLQQRLIAPSHFNMNFQFPGNQIFFKDFIVAAAHQPTFIEQLKIILANELTDLNESTYETLNLSTIDDNDQDNRHEYIVKADTLSTLSTLAKFLGFILARPFVYEYGINTVVDNHQIELRNKIRSYMDIKDILRKAIRNQKLVVTVPWVVQLISMLDQVCLHSDYYRNIFNILFELYMMMNEYSTNTTGALRPTSSFIIRSCLGWLFDQLNLSNEYYHYRQNRKSLDALLESAPVPINADMMAVRILVPKSMSEFFSETQQVHVNASQPQENPNKLVVTLEKCASTAEKSMAPHPPAERRPNGDRDLTAFDPLLESVLSAACPFLADFRVSIMPKYSKAVSRTGRYRHYTPKNFTSTSTAAAEPNPAFNNAHDMQAKLTEAFLSSQSLSVRRTVEFVTERVYSAVVKDFHVEVLVPFKRATVVAVDAIELRDSKAIMDEIYRIYEKSEKELYEKWQAFVVPAALERVKKSFDALLSHDTIDACKLTCINITMQQTLAKINEWHSTHLKGIAIFSKDIQVDVDRILKKSSLNQSQLENELKIVLSKRPPWQTFDALQQKLHQLTMHPERIQGDGINAILADIQDCITEHVLPDAMCKTIGIASVQLILLTICNRHDVVSQQIIDRCIRLWQCRQFALFVQPTNDDKCEETNQTNTECEQQTQQDQQNSMDTDYIFNMILSPANVFAQQSKPRICFELLASLIVKLIEKRLMTVKFISEQTMKLLRVEWAEEAWKGIAVVIQTVVDALRHSPMMTDDDVMFLEMLADWIRSLDDISCGND